MADDRTPAGVAIAMLPDDQREAIRRHAAGERVCFSTGIDGRTTYGYGRLDQNGYWQYLLRFEYLTPEQQEFIKKEDGSA